MQHDQSHLGTCPECQIIIHNHRLLIEYETDDGTDRFAECPNCERVVHPVS